MFKGSRLIQAIQDFVLQPIGSEDSAYQSRCLYQGRLFSTKIAGVSLEAQFRLPLGFLLFTTYDCPYEESLEITLLNQKLQTTDVLNIGAPYCSGGLFQVVEIKNDDFISSFGILFLPYA